MRGSLQLTDEVTDAEIEVIEGILFLVLDFLDGYVPRLMRAECGEAEEIVGGVRRFNRANLVVEGVERDVVAYAPFGSALFLAGVVCLPSQFLPTCTDQITAHVGEIDVAAVEVGSLVTLLSEC